MVKCPYRADKECKSEGIHIYTKCIACTKGQQADELSLLNSAIGNLTASIEERLCRK